MSKYLTQAEVDALPDGTKVIITWTGGNGPHEYEIAKYNDAIFVYEQRIGIDGKKHVNFGAGQIDFVGDHKPFTLVQLAGG